MQHSDDPKKQTPEPIATSGIDGDWWVSIMRGGGTTGESGNGSGDPIQVTQRGRTTIIEPRGMNRIDPGRRHTDGPDRTSDTTNTTDTTDASAEASSGSRHLARTLIKTTSPADAADTAAAEKVADGTATPQQALEYFQTHGYPFLSAPPTWHAQRGGGGHWDFPGAALVTAHRGRPVGSGPEADSATRRGTAPPVPVEEWEAHRLERWQEFWGVGEGMVTGTGTPDDPLTFPPDTIVVPPPVTPPSPLPQVSPDYATAEEEWEVAKQSAWNWLVNRMQSSLLVPPSWVTSWKYPVPPEADSGRAYELRQSYDAMQNFLSVLELGLSFISPSIVESAIEGSLASEWAGTLVRLFNDQAGTAAIGVSVQEISEARSLMERITHQPATDALIRDFLMYRNAYNEERAFMKMDGVPFEGFDEYILPGGDINIGMLRGSRAKDAAAANEIAGIDSLPPEYVWHHHPDFGRMVAIPRDIHDQLPHWGGVSIWKGLFGVDYP